MEDQLKANALTVYSTLGGGNHGYLGLVLHPSQYAQVSNTPFVMPNPPVPFQISQNEAAHEAQIRLSQHTMQIKLFQEATGVKKALLQQIVKSVDAPYLKALRSNITNTLEHLQIYDILGHLFTSYGYVSPTKLKQYEDAVRELTYDPADPIDDVFTAIENVATIAARAGSDYTHAHKNNLAYVILNKTGVYKSGLKSWLQTPLPSRTWENFKAHFRVEHNLLRVTNDGTLGESKLHQANLVQQVLEGVQHLLLQDPLPDPSAFPTPAPALPPPAPTPMPTPTHSANAIQQTADILPTLLAQMSQMQTAMLTMQKQLATQQQTVTPPNPSPASRSPKRKGTKYCWTHGLGKHNGIECENKAQGHQETATKDNRMGGSNRGCSNA